MHMTTSRFASISMVATVALCATAVPARAAAPVLGWSLVAGGGGAIAAAWDYRSSCGAGYTTHTFENLPTQCVHISQYGSDVRTEQSSATFKRPMLVKVGAATVAAGIVVLLLPERAQKVARTVDVAVTPHGGWQASTTVTLPKH